MTQPGLFDVHDRPAAEAARDTAMATAEAGAGDDWIRLARRTVLDVAREHRDYRPWTTDAVWAVLDQHPFGQPREPRALGPVIVGLVRAGVIRRVGYRPSARVACHARPIPLYETVPAVLARLDAAADA